MTKQTLNNDRIDELKELDDEGEVLKELIHLFLPSTEVKLSKLDIFLKTNDLSAIKAIAHEMRSSCANLGADRLSELSTSLEYLAVDQNYPEHAGELVKELMSEFIQVKSRLEKYL